jgi:signal transduction histidine kinase
MAAGRPSHYDRAMSLVETMAIVGVVVQGTLAMLLWVVWHALGSRWALLLLAGFVAISAQYVCVAVGHYNATASWTDQPKTLNAAFSLVGHGLITVALMAYTGVPAPWSRRLQALTAAVFGVALLALAPGWLNRGAAIGLISLAMCAWAALFAWAMLREPHAGHGIVMLAVLVYPASMAAAALGWLSAVGAGISLVVPHAVLGMTILTTGLVRAQKQSMRELLARQAVQEELERTNQTLEQRVALRTAQLRETIEGLESFNRSVSHDLRGPLGGITGVASLAREALARGDLAKADTLITAIARQSRASTELVASLLQLAHSAERPLDRGRVSVEPLVQEVVEALRGSLDDAPPSSSPPTQVVVASPLPDVQADPALLRQVFTNLLANGMKFSRGSAAPRVEVGASRSLAEGVVFHVRDNGVGLSPEQARGLFVPFRRLHANKFEGHGIGLTIVRRIVERHGGRVWAEGKAGEGAAFFFTLGSEAAADPAARSVTPIER